MSTSADPLNTAKGITKKVFGEIQDLVPGKQNIVTRSIPYDSKTKLGASFNELIWLTGEHGFTHGGTGGAELTLNAPAVAKSEEATALPESLHFRSRTTIELLSRAQAKGESSYESYVKRRMINSKKAFDSRLEARMIHGGGQLGTIVTGDAGAATTWAPTISQATWAPWLWIGKLTCPCDAYDGVTKLNTNADLVVSAVNPKTRVVSFTGNSSDITAIKAIGTNGSTVTLYYKGFYSTTALGVKTIAKTSSSTTSLYGITCATYPDFWCATQVPWDVTTDDFTWPILQNGLEESYGRGSGGDRIVMVPPGVWKTLNSQLDALRAFDYSFSVSKVEMGHELDAITYRSLGFKIEVRCSGNMMGGDVIVYPDPAESTDMSRKGSSNVTFELPDTGGEMMVQIYGTNLVENGAFSDQVLWAPFPRDFIYFGA